MKMAKRDAVEDGGGAMPDIGAIGHALVRPREEGARLRHVRAAIGTVYDQHQLRPASIGTKDCDMQVRPWWWRRQGQRPRAEGQARLRMGAAIVERRFGIDAPWFPRESEHMPKAGLGGQLSRIRHRVAPGVGVMIRPGLRPGGGQDVARNGGLHASATRSSSSPAGRCIGRAIRRCSHGRARRCDRRRRETVLKRCAPTREVIAEAGGIARFQRRDVSVWPMSMRW